MEMRREGRREASLVFKWLSNLSIILARISLVEKYVVREDNDGAP